MRELNLYLRRRIRMSLTRMLRSLRVWLFQTILGRRWTTVVRRWLNGVSCQRELPYLLTPQTILRSLCMPLGQTKNHAKPNGAFLLFEVATKTIGASVLL